MRSPAAQPNDGSAGLAAKRKTLRELRVRDEATVNGMQIDRLLQGFAVAPERPAVRPPRKR